MYSELRVCEVFPLT